MRGDVDMRRIFSYNQGMKKQIKIAAVTALVLSAAAFIVIYFVPVTFSKDELCNKLWRDTLPRVALSAAIFSLCVLCGVRGLFAVKREGALRAAVWCIPCLLVALANFPYSALITGEALIDRPDLIWLFILKCLFIAVSEELLFRGAILRGAEEGAGTAAAVLLSAVLFMLYHGSVEQTIYQFICGCVFALMAVRSASVLPSMLAHFVNNAVIIVLEGTHLLDDSGALMLPQWLNIMLTVLAALSFAAALVLLFIDKKPRIRGSSAQVKAFLLWAAVGIFVMALLWVLGLFSL